MKRINYLLSVCAIVTILVSGCKKKEVDPESTPQGIVVEEKNMSLVNKFTGSKCPPCGTWGWVMFDKLITFGANSSCNMGTYSQNFVAFNYITKAATQMDSSFGAYKNSSGWPTFAVNGSSKLYRPGGAVDTAKERKMCTDAISLHANATVEANSGYELTYDAAKTTATIKTRVKFFKDMSGEFYIAAYVIEDHVIGPQSGLTGDVSHHDVLRGSASASTWGTKISSATTAGSTFDYTFTTPVTAGWNTDNITVVTVIWRKNGSNYEFVNAWRKI